TGIGFFCLFLIAFQYFFRNQLRAMFFDREIAFTSGINEGLLYYMVILIVAITVALAMKLIGALLLDAILLLPPLIASFKARSLRSMVMYAAIWGGIFSVTGFLLSIAVDIPASSAVAGFASVAFVIILFSRKK
ncbi:MAG: metal ABC transporter permease, partial [Bacteroidota bacterium]